MDRRLEENRDVEKDSGRRPTLKERDWAIVNHTNPIGSVLKVTLRKHLRETGWSTYALSRALSCHLELN